MTPGAGPGGLGCKRKSLLSLSSVRCHDASEKGWDQAWVSCPIVWLEASSNVTCGTTEPAKKKPLARHPPAGPRPGPPLSSKLTLPTFTLSRLNQSFVPICARTDVHRRGSEKSWTSRDTKEPHPSRARAETSAKRHLAVDFEAPACASTWLVGHHPPTESTKRHFPARGPPCASDDLWSLHLTKGTGLPLGPGRGERGQTPESLALPRGAGHGRAVGCCSVSCCLPCQTLSLGVFNLFFYLLGNALPLPRGRSSHGAPSSHLPQGLVLRRPQPREG